MIKQINRDMENPYYEYDNNDERQQHIDKLLTTGWILTKLGGDGKDSKLFAQFNGKELEYIETNNKTAQSFND